MTERLRSASTVGYHCPKMENDLSPKKTMLVLVIVVGCFAVLWPKVFYPMLVGSANQHIKPSSIDKATGCCDVISETDVNTIKIMSELCGTIIKTSDEDKPLTGKEIVKRCRQEVLDTCGIDISVVLQEQVRLGQSVKQILDEIRSLNGSLCLKYNYGVAPWRLGVPHRITVKASESPNIRQERPMHLRSELIHPAFRERGSAIPHPQPVSPSRPPPRIVEGRPGPIPGMRPTIGGAGGVVPPKQGTSSMSIIMPVYTIGIVVFFTYTLMKILFKKQPEHVGGALYPPIDPDPHFRQEVFESESSRLGPKLTRENISSKLVVNAMSALLDEVDQEIEARRKSSEVASQDLVNGGLSNGDAVKPQDEDQPTVKVLGMEMTASCEGGKKWSRPDSPVLPTSPPPPVEPAPPPQEIYLEGALPAQSHLLVADSATEPEPTTGEDPAVVLSGKMTLSVISLDSEDGAEETNGDAEQATVEKEIAEPEPSLTASTQEFITKTVEELLKEEELAVAAPVTTQETSKLIEEILKEDFPLTTEPISNIEEEIENALVNLEDEDRPPSTSGLENDIEEFLQNLRKQNDFQAPSITLESEDVPETLEVECLEKEVDNLIQEAIASIQQKEPTEEAESTPVEPTNELKNDLSSTHEVTSLQSSNEEAEKSPLKQDFSEETEKIIQEVEQKTNEHEPAPISKKIEESFEKVNEEAEKLKLAQQTQALSNKVDEISQKIEEITSSIEEVAPISNLELETRAEAADTTGLKEEDRSTSTSNVEVEEKIEKVESKSDVLETKPETVEDRNKIEETSETIKNVEAEKVDIKSDIQATPDKPKSPELSSKKEESESKVAEPDDEELGSDEELVEEIEEIEYEDDEEEEEIEIEVEESEDEIPNERNTIRTESSSVRRVNGEASDTVEESKYTSVSGATAAENDISDEDLIDNEEVEEEEEEIIEVEEEIEDEDYLNEEGNDVNHVSGESEAEL